MEAYTEVTTHQKYKKEKLSGWIYTTSVFIDNKYNVTWIRVKKNGHSINELVLSKNDGHSYGIYEILFKTNFLLVDKFRLIYYSLKRRVYTLFTGKPL